SARQLVQFVLIDRVSIQLAERGYSDRRLYSGRYALLRSQGLSYGEKKPDRLPDVVSAAVTVPGPPPRSTTTCHFPLDGGRKRTTPCVWSRCTSTTFSGPASISL